MHTVAILVYDHINPFELAVATEVFSLHRPELGVEWYHTFVCSPEARPVPTRAGFSISTPYTLVDMVQADTIIVPSTTPGNLAVSDQLLEALREVYGRGARLVSFCTGAFVLAAAGLLDGRRAATHWQWTSYLAQQYPRVQVDPAVLFVDDGQVLTSAGTAAAIDLALYIVRKDYGAEIASALARRMVVPPLREGGQAQYIQSSLPDLPEHASFSAVLQWMKEHLQEELPIERLAAEMNMSQRTFARQFRAMTGTTPHQWLLQQRIVQAQCLLERTDETIERIAFLSGFSSASMLRIHFQRLVQTSPQAYRQSFNLKRATSILQSMP
ncbi:AraC family transcriptional regulator [Reticulibacter mediterranei]|uniref:AraC family transcriptional regulator n=1 Tax=Reticulibacter mediterranei TaxID=2778369 RepID=A0A8J3IML2_9CHLR|nr:helix-turn-helix domain-containing protein [Reticulibacter mediterranei]GHO96798.1 AraC family transcriptional regulator [Reticulibacter mediterranei]